MAGLLANNGKPLGKLRGPFFTNGENRNDYPCDDGSARNAEREDLMQEKIITGGVIGRLDHTNLNPDTNPNDETLVKEAAVNMQKFPQRNSKGQYIGECLILDTPEGQKLYAYCKSGKKPGISYRGGIDQEAYERGDIEGAWKQFTVEGFDIVYVPAYPECYLELVEDYLDPDSNIEPVANKRRAASIDVNGAARAMIKVAASKQGAKEMAKVMAQEKHFTEEEAVAINKAIDSANIDGDRRTKEQAKELGTPYDASPKHSWSRQKGNGTIDMFDEEGIYGDRDVDPITGKKIETLNTGNESEEDIQVLGLKTTEQKKAKEASVDRSKAGNIGKKVDELADEVADELVEEKMKAKTKAGIEKGTVAEKEKDEDEQLEGYVDENGVIHKKTEAGMLGVASEEETPEEKEKGGELGADGKVKFNKEKIQKFIDLIENKSTGTGYALTSDKGEDSIKELQDELLKFKGSDQYDSLCAKVDKAIEHIRKDVKSNISAITKKKASALGVNADDDYPEVEILTEDGIKELGSEIVEDESEEEHTDDSTLETLVEEIEKLTEEIADLKEVITGKDEEINNRNSELEELTASYKRLKGVVANSVDKLKGAETVAAENADLQQRNANLAKVIAKMKQDHKTVVAELTAEKDDFKRIIAGYEKETRVRNLTMEVQASALREQELNNRVLAGKNDNLGKLCIGMVADMLGIDEGKLLASRGHVKTGNDLQKVIASLQAPKRTIRASYYPITEGMQNALPDDLREVCENTDWNEEEEI